MTTLENSIDVADDALDSTSQASGSPPLFRSIMAKRSGVPFAHTLKQRIEGNCSIFVEATTDKNAEGFTVNLCHKHRDQQGRAVEDILLHINPRFNLNCVVRNSRIEGNWGREEIRTFRRSPFQRGAFFFLEIFITQQEFMVAVNGSHFCTYTHRKEVNLLNYVEIDGDVALHKVELVSKKHYPSHPSQLNSSTDLQAGPVTKSINRLTFNTILTVTGCVGLLPHAFHINLQIGRYVHPHPIIAFHMSVRWRPSEGDVVVFNSWFNGNWQNEARVSLTPDTFSPGQRFRMTIGVLVSGYSVTVNERRFPIYKHQFDIKGVDTLYVQGDVKIKEVKVHEDQQRKQTITPENNPSVKVLERKRAIS